MIRNITLAAAGLAIAATAVLAASHVGPFAFQIAARQSHMKLNGHNVYYLIGMVRGRAEYDAEAAQTAADNVVLLSQVNQGRYWPPGSDADAIDGTKALPAIWQNFPDVVEKLNAVSAAALELQAVAGNGLEPMGVAVTALNNACNACHKQYRKTE
ncbi:MAG: c-type cytochrome [Paracoccaceae bacterium]